MLRWKTPIAMPIPPAPSFPQTVPRPPERDALGEQTDAQRDVDPPRERDGISDSTQSVIRRCGSVDQQTIQVATVTTRT